MAKTRKWPRNKTCTADDDGGPVTGVRLQHLTTRELLSQRAKLERALRRRGASAQRVEMISRIDREIAFRRDRRLAHFTRDVPELPDDKSNAP